MSSPVHDNYLATEVLTAPPQKLRLMLIQAAIRWCERARQSWQADDREQAFEAVIRAQEIVSELLAGINTEVEPDLTRKVAAIYLFVFRSLVDANLHQSPQKLDEAVRVLREEEETWRQLCATLAGSERTAAAEFSSSGRSQSPPIPNLSSLAGLSDDSPSGFSVEA